MPDKLKYPRFGGDRKLAAFGALEMPSCWCCAGEKDTKATHAVTIERTEHVSIVINACGYHVGQARRPHTFEKFLAAAGGGS